MDKLADYDKGSAFGASKLYRFQCDCMTAADAMDIEVSEGPPEEKYFVISLNEVSTSFKNRLRSAWHAFRGEWCWREFVVRQEDAKNLSNIFDPDKKYSELP